MEGTFKLKGRMVVKNLAELVDGKGLCPKCGTSLFFEEIGAEDNVVATATCDECEIDFAVKADNMYIEINTPEQREAASSNTLDSNDDDDDEEDDCDGDCTTCGDPVCEGEDDED